MQLLHFNFNFSSNGCVCWVTQPFSSIWMFSFSRQTNYLCSTRSTSSAWSWVTRVVSTRDQFIAVLLTTVCIPVANLVQHQMEQNHFMRNSLASSCLQTEDSKMHKRFTTRDANTRHESEEGFTIQMRKNCILFSSQEEEHPGFKTTLVKCIPLFFACFFECSPSWVFYFLILLCIQFRHLLWRVKQRDQRMFYSSLDSDFLHWFFFL